MTTADQRDYARRLECEEDGLYFARYFFKQRMGNKMIVAPVSYTHLTLPTTPYV